MDDNDTAEDGRRENDKDRLIEELHEAVRARDEFVSIAAHELRNPMTPISSRSTACSRVPEEPIAAGRRSWRRKSNCWRKR